MKLVIQKRLASRIFGVSKKKVKFDPTRLEDLKEAITAADVRSLISDGAIDNKGITGISRHRARKKAKQKKKGRQKGFGNRKGTHNARLSKKDAWKNKIRVQRNFLKELKEKDIIDSKTHRALYLKSKGDFFRSKRHIKLFIEEQELAKKGRDKK